MEEKELDIETKDSQNETEEEKESTGARTFTQEEVNNIVQNRVNRLKEQVTKESKSEYEQKLADLQAREMKLIIKEKLDERGMPRELAEVLNCASEDEINIKLDALQKIYGNSSKEMHTEENSTGFRVIGVENNGMNQADDPVRKAMGL